MHPVFLSHPGLLSCFPIGINTAIVSPSGASSGVGFAIPADIVRSSVTQILRYGRVVRPMLGIAFAPDQVGARSRGVGMLRGYPT